MPLPADSSSSDQLIAAGEIKKMTETATSCAEIDTINTKLGSGQPSYVYDLELATVTPIYVLLLKNCKLVKPQSHLILQKAWW